MKKRKKIILAKPGLDGHDRGIQIVASALKEGGMDVVYLGLRQTPEAIVDSAVQNKADVIAVSILTGSHMTVFRKILRLLKEKGIRHILVTGGGIIPEEDRRELSRLGVGRLFGPGTPLEEIVSYIKNWKGPPP